MRWARGLRWRICICSRFTDEKICWSLFGMKENYPNYAGLVDGVETREAVKRTGEVEGMDLWKQ
jgi:hypothetical protein